MKGFLSIVLILIATTSCAQNSKYFSIELAGSGGFGSLNYEHNVMQRPKSALYMRYGFSFTPVDKNNGTNVIFPVMLHYLIGENANKLDVGIGQALSITTKGSLFIVMPICAGYRFQPDNKRYYLRFAYTPIVSYLVNRQWQNWVGITYGFNFNKKQ